MPPNDLESAGETGHSSSEDLETLITDFVDSPQFEELPRFQREEAPVVVENVVRILTTYSRFSLTECDQAQLDTVCTVYYPTRCDVDLDHAGAVAPVLSAFFRFLEDRGVHSNGEELAAYVAGLEEDILDATITPSDSGPVPPSERPWDDDPKVLDVDRGGRFLELFGHLLVYVNDKLEVVSEVDSFEAYRRSAMDDIEPIRDALFFEEDTDTLLSSFVANNPVGLSDASLEQIEAWTDYEAGEFVVFEHRPEDTVILDPDEPRAFGVKTLQVPLSEASPLQDLPVHVSEVVLLPFDGTIVLDGWFRSEPMSGMVREMMGKPTVDDLLKEAKHRYGVTETLPPGDDQRTDAERLRFYTKNKDNRERFADEIDQLRHQSEDLARIYHEEVGKGQARSLGRTFRDLGLEEAYVAIYDEQVVATAPTRSALRETLSSIMPEARVDHPYVYHYDP